MQNKRLEANVKITDDFFERISFKCDKCGTEAELITPEHDEWLSFCASNNRNPEELQFAFSKQGCPTDCDGVLVLEERGTLTALKLEETTPQVTNPTYTIRSENYAV